MILPARAVFVRNLSLATLLLGLTACGGSGSEAKGPDGEGSRNSDGSSAESGFSSEGDGPSQGPTGPDCGDGTCFECGEGICPKGAYCDQDAEGGAACAWLPECSGTAACSCITGVLKDCTCDEASGNPLVSCQ